MKPNTLEIEDVMKARELAARLVDSSVWFEVTPLPDDFWEFHVKLGDESALHHALALVNQEE